MKKINILKVIVVLQAIAMIAFAGFVVWEVSITPYLHERSEQEYRNEQTSHLEGTDEVVASIGTETITREELISELIEIYGNTTLEQILKYKAIDLAAKELQITVLKSELDQAIAEASKGYSSPEQYFKMLKNQLGLTQKKAIEDIRYQLLLEKIATQHITVTEDEIKAYMEWYEQWNAHQVLFQLSWILTENREQAMDIMDALSEGASFSELAMRYSIDDFSAPLGGSLGEIAYDDPFYDRALLDEALVMNVGDIAGPIEVENGFAIIYLTGKQNAEKLSQAELVSTAKRQIALEKAAPLSEIVQQLLRKYNAVIKK